eukprot:1027816-Pyramimonas_sp.AAC.1
MASPAASTLSGSTVSAPHVAFHCATARFRKTARQGHSSPAALLYSLVNAACTAPPGLADSSTAAYTVPPGRVA